MEEKLCDECIKKLCVVFGDDLGLTEPGEFYDTFKMTFADEWISELCKKWDDPGKVHYLIALYCNGNFEEYYKYSIEWLLKNKSDVKSFERFLIEKEHSQLVKAERKKALKIHQGTHPAT